MTLDHCDPPMTQSINCLKLNLISLFINVKGGQQEKAAEKLQILVGQPSHGVRRCSEQPPGDRLIFSGEQMMRRDGEALGCA